MAEYAHEQLAEVATVEQSQERRRGLVEPFDDVLAVLQLPFLQPPGALLQKHRQAVAVIGHDESFERGALREKRAEVGPGWRFGGVVFGDHPTKGNARVLIDEPEHGRQHWAGDVVEVHIDAARTRVAQRVGEAVARMVHTGVEPELADDVVALRLRAGHPDRSAPFDARDLGDDRADGPRRRRHDSDLSGFLLTDVEQADVGSEARHAKNTESGRNGRRSRIQLAEVLAARTAVLLP